MKLIPLCWLVFAMLSMARTDLDQVLHHDAPAQAVSVDLLIPAGSPRPLRGLLVHVAHHQVKHTGRWPTLIKELGFGHVVAKVDLKKNNRPTRLRDGINEALEAFAAETGRAELTRLPRMGTGMSAGGMCIPVLIAEPDKYLTSAVSCSWVTKLDKIDGTQAALPNLYVIGAVPDAFKMLPAITNNYIPSVTAGNPWALGLQHECKHDWANSGTLFVPWFRGVAALRLPEEPVRAGDPVPLRPIEPGTGWRGDWSTIHGQLAGICAAADYRGEPGHQVWLPDRACAYVWRAWQSKDAPVQLTAEEVDGDRRLPEFKPRKSFGLSFPAGAAIRLGARVEEGVDVTDIEFWHEDVRIGPADDQGGFTWTPPGRKAYAVYVAYRRDGEPGVGNPALLCIEDLNPEK